MKAPQIIMICLFAFNLLVAAVMDGKPKKEEKHNFGLSLITLAIQVGLLIWGGFFKF